MTLQDWFYTIGIVYMILGMIVMIALFWLIVWAGEQLKRMKMEAEIKSAELSAAIKNWTRPSFSTTISLIPIGWRIFRRIFR